MAADDFSTYVADSYGYVYTYCSTNVSLPLNLPNPQTGGTAGSVGAAAVLDGSAWAGVQVDWAGLAAVFYLPASVSTPYLHAYQYSFDARVENLLPGKTNTECGLTLTFKTPGSDALNASHRFFVSSNYQHFTFNLDAADFGNSGAADLAAFPTNLHLVNALQLTLVAYHPADDFVRGPRD